MTATGKHRGHQMYFDQKSNHWRYLDNDDLVHEKWFERPCNKCLEHTTEEGHDPCIKNLPNVKNACCGHGSDSEAYIQYENGIYKSGAEAVKEFEKINLL